MTMTMTKLLLTLTMTAFAIGAVPVEASAASLFDDDDPSLELEVDYATLARNKEDEGGAAMLCGVLGMGLGYTAWQFASTPGSYGTAIGVIFASGGLGQALGRSVVRSGQDMNETARLGVEGFLIGAGLGSIVADPSFTDPATHIAAMAAGGAVGALIGHNIVWEGTHDVEVQMTPVINELGGVSFSVSGQF